MTIGEYVIAAMKGQKSALQVPSTVNIDQMDILNDLSADRYGIMVKWYLRMGPSMDLLPPYGNACVLAISQSPPTAKNMLLTPSFLD